MEASPQQVPSPSIGALSALVAQARSLALAYRALTGRPLGVTGEVGEFEAIRLLGLDPAPVRCPGFDAVDLSGKRYQIKARCIPFGASRAQSLGSIKVGAPWDAVLLVLLDNGLAAREIWQAERESVEAALAAPGSKARNERGALAISKFKSIGSRVWPPFDLERLPPAPKKDRPAQPKPGL